MQDDKATKNPLGFSFDTGFVHLSRASLGKTTVRSVTTLKTPPRWHGKYLRGTSEAVRWRQISVACRNWTATMTWWNSSIYHSAMSHLISHALRLLDSVMKNEGSTKWCIPASVSHPPLQLIPGLGQPYKQHQVALFLSFTQSLHSSQTLCPFCTSTPNLLKSKRSLLTNTQNRSISFLGKK